MKKYIIGFSISWFALNVSAGCIGPIIMGECKGSVVEWDTHPLDYKESYPAPAGFHWDKRGAEIQDKHPEWINPFTGRDAHDSNWFQDY